MKQENIKFQCGNCKYIWGESRPEVDLIQDILGVYYKNKGRTVWVACPKCSNTMSMRILERG